MSNPRRRILPAVVLCLTEKEETVINHSVRTLCVGTALPDFDRRGYRCDDGKLRINTVEANHDLGDPGGQLAWPDSKQARCLVRNRACLGVVFSSDCNLI